MVTKKKGYADLASKEWLVTNGLGSYASSSITGSNTRRYHGLMVASFNPPTERRVLVSKVQESIFTEKEEIHLSTNQYDKVVHPEGYKNLESFERRPLPAFSFKSGKARLLKTVFMVFNSNTTVVEYQNTSAIPYRLRLNPLYTSRDYHSVAQETPSHYYHINYNNNLQSIYAYQGSQPLFFKHSDGMFVQGRTWNKNIHYAIEEERGQDFIEDIYSCGYVEHELKPGATIYLVFTLDAQMAEQSPQKLKENELERLTKLVPENTDPFLADLLRTGEQFIVHRKSTENYSIIAGYHWFTDWGRDSMIVLRGLCIATGKQKEAASIITTFLNYLNEGIIPNRFPDYKDDQPEYHTIDATLWLFVAVYEYDLKFNDTEFLRRIYHQLIEIINYHLLGTKHNIKVLDNGLLYGGTMGLPLTWMDARIKDHIFTPRIGCPVEINALWYNALRIYEHVTERLDEQPNDLYVKVRGKVQEQFVKSFWNEEGYLNDLVSIYNDTDPSIRPNQVYAVSLPFSLLSPEQEKQVVENIRKHLVTDFGLRTLNPAHPDFKPRYEGDVWLRDAAYHQGTVWPFLLGEFYFAYLKVNDHSAAAKKEVEKNLQPLKDHFYNQQCLYGISEIFDGKDPREGKGCINQAWSVSNLVLLILREGLTV